MMSPIRTSLHAVQLICFLALSLAACGDDAGSDDDGAGAGGTAGSGGTGGAGGTGGSGGTGGAGGTGGSGGTGGGASADPCPDSSPNCNADTITTVCNFMVQCDQIPGPTLTQERCEAEITVDCVDCAVDSTADGGVTDPNEPADCSITPSGECDSSCSFLIDPPTNRDECLDIQAAGDNSEAYGVCLCDMCMSEFTDCLADTGCWKIVQCAIAVDCNGMACYAPTTCMAVIDEVGATSLSTALSTELGVCNKDSGCIDL